MTYRGYVRNGNIVLDPPATLPEGTEVEVCPKPEKPEEGEEKIPTLYERYKDFIGIIEDGPTDAAENHDHYLYGTPKR